MIKQILFPKPKKRPVTEKERHLIYIPSFKSKVSYKIFQECMKNQVRKTRSSSNVALKYTSANKSYRKDLTDIESNPEEDFLKPNPAKQMKFFDNKVFASTNNDLDTLELDKFNEVKESSRLIKNESKFLYSKTDTVDFKTPKKHHKSMIKQMFSGILNTRTMSKPDPRTNMKLTFKCPNLNFADQRFLTKDFDHNIPCLFYPVKDSKYYLLYFHSNGEDMFHIKRLGEILASELLCNIILVEYPGYSIYYDKSPSADLIYQDAENIIEFLKTSCHVETSDILLIGRSLGSGPVLHLCSLYRYAFTVLISPFLSIKEVVKDRSSIVSMFFDSHFDNESKIKENRTPLLFLHGKDDNIVKCRHSEELYKLTRSKAKLILFDNMKHNSFIFRDCVLKPMQEQLDYLEIDPKSSIELRRKYKRRELINVRIRSFLSKKQFVKST